VGRGELPSADVFRTVHPDYQDTRASRPQPRTEEDGWFNLRAATGMLFRIPGFTRRAPDAPEAAPDAIPIRVAGDDTAVHFGPDGAVPGDRIVGIIEPGKGITIYPIQSPALTAFDDEPDRWVDVRWDIDAKMTTRFPARVRIAAINEPGVLAEIAETIAINDANIHALTMAATAPDVSTMVLDLEVWDLQHLTRTLNQLRAKACVSDAVRVNG